MPGVQSQGIYTDVATKAAYSGEVLKADSNQQQELDCRLELKEDNDNEGYDDDTPMQIRLRNQIRNNQSRM